METGLLVTIGFLWGVIVGILATRHEIKSGTVKMGLETYRCFRLKTKQISTDKV